MICLRSALTKYSNTNYLYLLYYCNRFDILSNFSLGLLHCMMSIPYTFKIVLYADKISIRISAYFYERSRLFRL